MLSARAAVWPTDGDWAMEPKWDGFRLLVEIDSAGRIRAWSRHATSLTEHLDGLLEPLLHAPRASILDAELIALSSRNHGVVQDFAAVRRATLQGNAAAARQLQLVAFDLLELAAEDLRPLPWTKRTAYLKDVFPVGERLRLIQPMAASRAAHDQLVELGFEGTVLKRPGSTYRPGRHTAWRKYKATHRATATLRALRSGRDRNTYAICELDGRRVTAPGSPCLDSLIGQQLELAYSRIDADGSLREARISSIRPQVDNCANRYTAT